MNLEETAIPVERAAQILHCSRARVFELLAKGALCRAQSAGRKTLVLTASVMEFLHKPVEPENTPRRRRGKKEKFDLPTMEKLRV